jgi:hypothetical protein
VVYSPVSALWGAGGAPITPLLLRANLVKTSPAAQIEFIGDAEI